MYLGVLHSRGEDYDFRGCVGLMCKHLQPPALEAQGYTVCRVKVYGRGLLREEWWGKNTPMWKIWVVEVSGF